jgi:hypothetical protein
MTSRQPTRYRVVVLTCLPPSLEKLCQEEELKDLLTEGTEEAEREVQTTNNLPNSLWVFPVSKVLPTLREQLFLGDETPMYE